MHSNALASRAGIPHHAKAQVEGKAMHSNALASRAGIPHHARPGQAFPIMPYYTKASIPMLWAFHRSCMYALRSYHATHIEYPATNEANMEPRTC
jgi:hypothetical protein